MGLFLPGGISVNSYREKVTLELDFETYVVGYGVGLRLGEWEEGVKMVKNKV